MKLNLLIPFGIIIFLNGFVSNATTLIVDNHFPTPAGEYATIQLAYNAASSGDTIIISPSDGEYTGITITKQVHIVGNGWTRPSSIVPNTKTSGFIFNPGAQGSSITGLEVNGLFDILTSNITIKRNKCKSILVEANCMDIVIIQNFIQSSQSNGSIWYAATMISLWENTEVLISNNIIINTYHGSASVNGIYNLYPGSLIACNNIIEAEDYSFNFSMSEGNYTTHSIYNNIVIEGEISAVIGSYNNIGNSTQFPATDGNQQNVVMSNVFEDPDNNDFHLKAGSPAIGAGFGGTDCGIYGGNHVFVDDGRTWLPIIDSISVPTEVNKSEGLNVTIKAKSGN